ncbi:MAG: GldG family protein [Gammaproteobacteria bacterium]
MALLNKSTILNRLHLLIFITLFSISIGLLAWLSTQYSFYSDWTYGNRHSLSQDTQQLLASLDGPVLIRSYQVEDISMEQAVNDILGRYQRIKPDISYRLVNPELEPDLARADNISRYGQTIIKYKQQTETIDSLSEQNISNALLRLSREHKATLYFLSGHGERKPTDISPLGYNTLSNQLVSQGFALKSLQLLEHSLQNIDGTLVISSPSHPLLAGEIEQITQFIDQGGNLLWLQDPGEQLGLEALAQHLKVQFIDGVVVDDDQNLRTVLNITHPAKLPILSYKLHPITENMKYFTLFITASALYARENEEWQSTPILLTQDSSWSETDGFIIDAKFDLEQGDTKGPLSIGLALQREHEGKQQRIVIIGDTDFISNNNIGQGANLTFTMNSLNWLTEDEALISISVKNAPDTQLNLDDSQIAIIGFGFLILLPLLLLASGFYIWNKRRLRQ